MDVGETRDIQRRDPGKNNGQMIRIIRAIGDGDNQKAKVGLESLLRKDPENEWAFRLYGKYLNEELDEVNAEIEKTKKVLLVNSDYKAAWLRLSLLYKKAGLTELANEANKKAGVDNF